MNESLNRHNYIYANHESTHHESTHHESTHHEHGAAMVYILFISVVFGIVMLVILLTVTQGQRHIAGYEDRQKAEYLTEGAFEVSLGIMETYEHPTEEDERGIYFFVRNELSVHNADHALFEVEIDDQMIQISGQIESEDEDWVTLSLFDLDRPHLQRMIRVAHLFEADEGEVPIFDDGIPEFEPEEGTIYEDDGENIVEVGYEEVASGYFQTPDRLVITSATDPIHVVNSDVFYDADGGIYLGTDLSNAPYNDITLYSSDGHIYIGEGADVHSSRTLTIEAENGHIVSEDATYSSVSYGNINLHAGEYISFVDVNFNSSNHLHLTAKNIYLERVSLSSVSNGVITLHAQEKITIKDSDLSSSNLIEIEGGGAIVIQNSTLTSRSNAPITIDAGESLDISGSTLTSPNMIHLQSNGAFTGVDAYLTTGSWVDLRISSSGSMNLRNAFLQATRNLYLDLDQAGAALNIAGAQLRADSHHVATVTPAGVVITGIPAFGCVSTATTEVCHD